MAVAARSAVGARASVVVARRMASNLVVALVVMAWNLSRMETGSVVVGILEVLRDSALVARIGDSTAVAWATWVFSGLELLLDSAVLVAAKVVDLVGVLAVDDLATMAVSTVAVSVAAGSDVGARRAGVVVAGRAASDTVVVPVVVGAEAGLVFANTVVVADLLTGVETGSVMVWVLEVLRDSTLVAGIGDSTTVARATGVVGRLELFVESSVLVASIVVKLVTVETASSGTVSIVASAAKASTPVDGGGINSFVISLLGLLDKSGERAWALVLAWNAEAVVVTLNFSCGSNGGEASKRESLEHVESFLEGLHGSPLAKLAREWLYSMEDFARNREPN